MLVLCYCSQWILNLHHDPKSFYSRMLYLQVTLHNLLIYLPSHTETQASPQNKQYALEFLSKKVDHRQLILLVKL
jgi:hypothetical protein